MTKPKKKAVAEYVASGILALLLNVSVASADYIRIDFSGPDYGGASVFQGGTNELGLQHGDLVSGHVILNMSATDLYPADPLVAQLQYAVTEFSLGSVSHGSMGMGWSYYYIHATQNVIGVYANNIINGVSDVFSINLGIIPGILSNDSFDPTALNVADLNSGTPASGNAGWLFQRNHIPQDNSLGPTVVYGGYINAMTISAFTSVPAPETLVLFALGFVALGISRRKQALAHDSR